MLPWLAGHPQVNSIGGTATRKGCREHLAGCGECGRRGGGISCGKVGRR